MFPIKRTKDETIEHYKTHFIAKGFIYVDHVLTIMLLLVLRLSLLLSRWYLALQFLGVGPYTRLILTTLFSMGHLMMMPTCHNLLPSLTLIILTMSTNSRKLFTILNMLLELGTLNYTLTFFTWASLHHNLILHFLFFERAIPMLISCVHVDDIIFIDNDPHQIDQLVVHLVKHFSLKDSNPLQYFIGVEVSVYRVNLLLSH